MNKQTEIYNFFHDNNSQYYSTVNNHLYPPSTCMSLTSDYRHYQTRTPSNTFSHTNFSSPSTTDLIFPLPSQSSSMKYSSKKQSWLDFINESMGNNIKNEAIERDLNQIPSSQSNDINYTIIDPEMDSLHSTNKTMDGSSIRISPFEKSNISNSKQQQQQQKDSLVNYPTSPEERRRCAVCSDVASGYHYGVWSCEGCKAFFKRSIQGTNDYICPATNTCTIDKHRRKSCQACRLRRCYEVGMTKGTTRRERKYRKKAVSVCKITSTSSHTNPATNTNGNNQEHGLLVSTTNTRPPIGTPSGSQTNNSNAFSSSQLQINKTTSSESTRSLTTPAEFISTLSQASRLNLPAKVDANRPLDDQYFLQLLAKIFDQELVVLINWAKAMPGYTESLTLDQQVTIIEQSWLDTLLLDIIERSLERNDDTLQFAPDFIITKNRDLSSPCFGSICTYLFNIIQSFKDPRTTHEEFIALKATILINSVPATISSAKTFRLLTNQIYQAIQYTCDSNPSVYHDNYIRHFTLLLQLPHIKMLSAKLIKLFLDMRTHDLLPQADLLLEMLDAQDTFDISFNTDIHSLSSRTPSFSQHSLSTNNIPPTVFPIDNSSIYENHYSNISTIEIDKNNLSDLSGKRSPSTPPPSFYKRVRNDHETTSGNFLDNNSSY